MNWLQWIILVITILSGGPVLAAGASAALAARAINFERPEWGAQALFATALLVFGAVLLILGFLLAWVAS